jgi:hypothetical protein
MIPKEWPTNELPCKDAGPVKSVVVHPTTVSALGEYGPWRVDVDALDRRWPIQIGRGIG